MGQGRMNLFTIHDGSQVGDSGTHVSCAKTGDNDEMPFEGRLMCFQQNM